MALKEKLLQGQKILGTWHVLCDPEFVEVAAITHQGLVCVDAQHGNLDFEKLCSALALIAPTEASLAMRIPAHDYAFAGRAVDAGAEAIIAPLIDNAEDAQKLVNAIKYPPLGGRSWGPGGAMKYSGISDSNQYLKSANEQVLAFAMIETREGVDNLDDILSVDGIDGVLVGPGDLSIGLSNGAQFEPYGEQSLPVIKHIAERARYHGKYCAAFANSEEHTEIAKSFGFDIITVGIDARLFAEGIAKAINAAKG